MTPPRRRADATENRARIIEAARAVHRERQTSLKLNAIAKRAGVGQGTLYRHFPTREDLLAEVYRQDVDELVAAAPALLAEHEPQSTRCVRLVRPRGRLRARSSAGCSPRSRSAVWQDLSAHSLGPIGDAVTTLLDAGKSRRHRSGADVDARDVILPHRLSDTSRCRPNGTPAPEHLLDIILDGLRNRS